MFTPALTDIQLKANEPKTGELNLLIERLSKEVKRDSFEEMEKIKQEVKVGSEFKSLGLLIESIQSMKRGGTQAGEELKPLKA
jgi:hypothetical protein